VRAHDDGMDRIRLAIRRFTFAMTALVACASLGSAADPVRGPLVVELFTSQGCSSCPPADRLLGELAKRPDVIALSFHVNYWDRLGWKDPFASESTTARQHGYARALAQSYVYTPEMVVNGVVHDPGNSPDSVSRLLAQATAHKPLSVRPVVTIAPDKRLVISLPASRDAPEGLDVWLFTYDATHTTQVERGENRGATLVNRHVVRSVEKLAVWNGAAASWTVNPPTRSVAVLVQRRDFGPIVGAARWEPATAN
jgi:hypothetical protein